MQTSIFDWLAAGDDAEPTGRTALLSSAAAPAGSDGDLAAQILRERPDVYAAYYREFYSALNDRHSPAWVDRVGGNSPEDYARYWFRTYADREGYTPGESSGASAALEDGEAPVGRTTYDGVPIAKILADRPDVFQAFFTEYYGAGNDRHSGAWVQRVGGNTVEDYADYWYKAHGKAEGYRPSVASPQPEPAPGDEPPDDDPPVFGEDDDDLVIPPFDGDDDDFIPPPEADPDIGLARPLIVTYFDDGTVDVTPATLEQMRSLFDGAAF
ncbi:hypothetical protein [Phenylobacterium sp.]|uniref:hypothetical protein n=1 Tax=Phenylobacterium sp. TaxID=1871053 RepID=UPI0025FBE9C8|nr:hypothetical protein [Phenylobacterium sp.]MBX3485166.1 hypothetical protein [Phenylobacterium sp.]MCW5761144.1 hypothetical protein [Phenylobacterium sp.]